MMKASFSGCLYYCNDMYLNFRYRNFFVLGNILSVNDLQLHAH